MCARGYAAVRETNRPGIVVRVGRGCSIVVDPEGAVLQETQDATAGDLYQTVDLASVQRVREVGTAGTNRMWAQFLPTDRSVELPAASIPTGGHRSRQFHDTRTPQENQNARTRLQNNGFNRSAQRRSARQLQTIDRGRLVPEHHVSSRLGR